MNICYIIWLANGRRLGGLTRMQHEPETTTMVKLVGHQTYELASDFSPPLISLILPSCFHSLILNFGFQSSSLTYYRANNHQFRAQTNQKDDKNVPLCFHYVPVTKIATKTYLVYKMNSGSSASTQTGSHSLLASAITLSHQTSME